MPAYNSAFSRPPAPPPLDLVQAFLNSVDLEDGPDEFATPESLEAWAANRIHAAGPLTEADRLRAVSVREALRDFVEGDGSGKPAGTLQQTLDTIPFTLRIDHDNAPRFVPRSTGIDTILAPIFAGVYQAMIEGSWDRLKICRNDTCRWAFYDASKNHSGAWCSMATCGSKSKARAYRSRARKKVTS